MKQKKEKKDFFVRLDAEGKYLLKILAAKKGVSMQAYLKALIASHSEISMAIEDAENIYKKQAVEEKK